MKYVSYIYIKFKRICENTLKLGGYGKHWKVLRTMFFSVCMFFASKLWVSAWWNRLITLSSLLCFINLEASCLIIPMLSVLLLSEEIMPSCDCVHDRLLYFLYHLVCFRLVFIFFCLAKLFLLIFNDFFLILYYYEKKRNRLTDTCKIDMKAIST